MLVTIIYNTEFGAAAGSLKGALLEEWSDVKINKMGINGAISNAKYQIQLNGSVVYSGKIPVDNTTIINSIKERL
jgi:hypothetical protein|tara:strand:+ start:480 stop:704 length:225 start_codon:yes stop_codon:yes gene_type:complete